MIWKVFTAQNIFFHLTISLCAERLMSSASAFKSAYPAKHSTSSGQENNSYSWGRDKEAVKRQQWHSKERWVMAAVRFASQKKVTFILDSVSLSQDLCQKPTPCRLPHLHRCMVCSLLTPSSHFKHAPNRQATTLSCFQNKTCLMSCRWLQGAVSQYLC